jgi:hypothetical protein
MPIFMMVNFCVMLLCDHIVNKVIYAPKIHNSQYITVWPVCKLNMTITCAYGPEPARPTRLYICAFTAKCIMGIISNARHNQFGSF